MHLNIWQYSTFYYFCQPQRGGLAQLARALAWHARGHRFESVILHIMNQAFRLTSRGLLFLGTT